MCLVHAGAARTETIFLDGLDSWSDPCLEGDCVCLLKAVRFDKGRAAVGEGSGGALFCDVVGSILLCRVVLRVAGYLHWVSGCLCHKAERLTILMPRSAPGREGSSLLGTSGRRRTSRLAWMKRRGGLRPGGSMFFSYGKLRVAEPHTIARSPLGPVRDVVSASLFSDSPDSFQAMVLRIAG